MSWVRRIAVPLRTTLCVVLLLAETILARTRDYGSVVRYWGHDSRSTSRCVALPANMTLCRGVGYDRVRLPNLLGHETLSEATAQANSWVLLVNIYCHPDTQVAPTVI